jgi:hypothetical protein
MIRTTTFVPQPARRSIPVSVPVYVRAILLLSACMATLVASWLLPLGRAAQPSNPFASYAAILPGQPRQAVIEQQFSCPLSNLAHTQQDYEQARQREYCTRAPAVGPFSFVAVTMSNGVVSRVEFSLREAALTVGDLALLWGRPDKALYRQSINLEWSNVGVTASGWAESHRFNYANPVLRLTFAGVA